MGSRARRACLIVSLACTAAGAASCPQPPEPLAPAPPMQASRRRIGVALGSGSTHGLAHIGVIEELEARGVAVSVVAGTSVGAVVGALWASGSTGAEIENLSREGDWEKGEQFSPGWQALYSNQGLRTQMQKLLPRPIESWPRRFGAVATELATGKRRVLSRGDGANAVLASTAMPVVFPPVMVDGHALVDGALVEPVPSRAARELGADFVIAVDVAYRPYEEPARGLVQSAFQAMHVLVNSLASEQARHADFVLRLDLHQTFMECAPVSMVYAGRLAVRERWSELSAALAWPR